MDIYGYSSSLFFAMMFMLLHLSSNIFIYSSFWVTKIFSIGHQTQKKIISPHHQGWQVLPWHITLPVLNLLT